MDNTLEIKCKVCLEELSIFAINQGIVELDDSTIPPKPICNKCNKKNNKNTKTPYQLLIEKVEEYSINPDIWSDILAIATEIEPYDTNQDYCYPEIQMNCSGNGGRVGKNSWNYCGGCYDGFMGPVSWKAYENLLSNSHFSSLKKSEIEQIYAAINNKKFYPPKPVKKKYYKTRKCKFSQCKNILYLKTNKQYCSYACGTNYRNSDEYKKMVKDNIAEDKKLWKLIKEKNFTDEEIKDYTGLATMRKLYNLKFGPEEILQYRELKDQFWQEIYDKEDREHKYYMKHEHQFENYADAKEWYDSQNQ